jgi:hypothetical protein
MTHGVRRDDEPFGAKYADASGESLRVDVELTESELVPTGKRLRQPGYVNPHGTRRNRDVHREP